VTRFLQTLASLVLALTTTATAGPQDAEKPKTPEAVPKTAAAVVNMPLKVQVVIGRYQGEEKISSMPFTLSLNGAPPNNHANLRMGSKIPVVMMLMTNVPPKDAPASGPVQYQDVGTNIDCSATAIDDGRFMVSISVEDTSVYPERGPGSGNPSFRSFRAGDTMTLRNGQTAQFTAATDKISGEQTRVDVTLTVVK